MKSTQIKLVLEQLTVAKISAVQALNNYQRGDKAFDLLRQTIAAFEEDLESMQEAEASNKQ